MIIQQTFLKALQAAGVSTFTSLGSAGTATVNNDVLNFTPNKTLNAGTLLVLLYEQSASNFADPTVTDTKGNTYTKVGTMEYGRIYITKLTTTLTTSDLVKFTGTGTSSRVCTVWQYDIPSGMNVYAETPATASQGFFNATPSMSLSGLTSRTYLFVRGIYAYFNGYTITGSITATSGYTTFSNSTITNGNATDFLALRGEWTIATGTGTTSNPGDPFQDTPTRNILCALYLAP